MRKLYLVIPVSAIVLTALVLYKSNEPTQQSSRSARFEMVSSAAPPLTLFDEQSQLVRLERYVGRHKLVVVFFDGRDGPDRSPLLLDVRRQFPGLHQGGAIVLAVSEATPFANRQGLERLEDRFPFPLLSDPTFEYHARWQAFDAETQRTRPTLVVVDRARRIRWHRHVGQDSPPWEEIRQLLPLIP